MKTISTRYRSRTRSRQRRQRCTFTCMGPEALHHANPEQRCLTLNNAALHANLRPALMRLAPLLKLRNLDLTIYNTSGYSTSTMTL
eukprot:scaffold11028_cov57-Phaeocystis_antarctica.AAC.2